MALFRSRPSQYKTSSYETARNLIRSRNHQRNRAKRLRGRVDALEAENQQLRSSLKQCEEQLLLHRQIQELGGAASAGEGNPVDDSPLSAMRIVGHHFTAGMIALCINLARHIDFVRLSAPFKSLSTP